MKERIEEAAESNDGQPQPQQLGGHLGQLSAAVATLIAHFVDPRSCLRASMGALLGVTTIFVDRKGPK